MNKQKSSIKLTVGIIVILIIITGGILIIGKKQFEVKAPLVVNNLHTWGKAGTVEGIAFSYDGLVDDRHILNKENESYKKVESLNEGEHLEIPSKDAESLFSIKNGFFVQVMFGSKLSSISQIVGFKGETFIGSPVFYIKLSKILDSTIENSRPFFVMAKNKSDLDRISEFASVSEVKQESETYKTIRAKIADYFDKNRDKLETFLGMQGNEASVITKKEIEEIFNNKTGLHITELNLGSGKPSTYVVTGENDLEEEKSNNSFKALISLGSNDISLMAKRGNYSRFLQAFKIDDIPHVLFLEGRMGTGIQGAVLYKINQDQFESIFNDYSYSA